MTKTQRDELLALIPVFMLLFCAWSSAWAMMAFGAFGCVAAIWLCPPESRKTVFAVMIGSGAVAALAVLLLRIV